MIRRAALWLLPFALTAPAIAHAQVSETAVKGAFLVKFGAYVTWPGEREAITLCVVGRDPFGDALNRSVAGQQIDGRPIVLRRIDTVDRNSGCAIAYLAGSSKQPVATALAALRGSPVLTVTDARWSNTRGMVHFQIASNRVRFHADAQAAAQSGLEISSKLLALALSVRHRRGG